MGVRRDSIMSQGGWGTAALGGAALGGAALGAACLLLTQSRTAKTVDSPAASSVPSTADFPATSWCPTKGHTDGPPLPFEDFDVKDMDGSFMRVGNTLIKEATAHLHANYEMPEKEVEWIVRMLNYNVNGGKMTRGKMVVQSAMEIAAHQNRTLDSDELNKLTVLGWCIEWTQAWLLVADDFMDTSTTRRGQKCWYLVDDVKNIALNDAFMIEALVYKLLKRYFLDSPYYLQLLDLFLETTFQTECGQLADTLCMNHALSDFTLERWTLIVKYKTSFYSFYLPVALAMITAGITDKAAYDSARTLLMRMGIYFQAQDDFLDCFQTEEKLGKVGTDIQDKKCGWLFAHVYHGKASEEQKALLDANYGKCTAKDDKEKEIKEMYAALEMESFYNKYEEEEHAGLTEDIAGCHEQLPRAVFDTFLKKIYKRPK